MGERPPSRGTTVIACRASCATVEAVRGSDCCLLVTEPTPFDAKIARWTSAGDMVVDRSPRYATFFGRLARRLLLPSGAMKWLSRCP